MAAAEYRVRALGRFLVRQVRRQRRSERAVLFGTGERWLRQPGAALVEEDEVARCLQRRSEVTPEPLRVAREVRRARPPAQVEHRIRRGRRTATASSIVRPPLSAWFSGIVSVPHRISCGRWPSGTGAVHAESSNRARDGAGVAVRAFFPLPPLQPAAMSVDAATAQRIARTNTARCRLASIA